MGAGHTYKEKNRLLVDDDKLLSEEIKILEEITELIEDKKEEEAKKIIEEYIKKNDLEEISLLEEIKEIEFKTKIIQRKEDNFREEEVIDIDIWTEEVEEIINNEFYQNHEEEMENILIGYSKITEDIQEDIEYITGAEVESKLFKDELRIGFEIDQYNTELKIKNSEFIEDFEGMENYSYEEDEYKRDTISEILSEKSDTDIYDKYDLMKDTIEEIKEKVETNEINQEYADNIYTLISEFYAIEEEIEKKEIKEKINKLDKYMIKAEEYIQAWEEEEIEEETIKEKINKITEMIKEIEEEIEKEIIEDFKKLIEISDEKAKEIINEIILFNPKGLLRIATSNWTSEEVKYYGEKEDMYKMIEKYHPDKKDYYKQKFEEKENKKEKIKTNIPK
jgi:hypothetical protein